MPFLLPLLLVAAPVAVDVDTSGLSALERAALDDRVRREVGGDVVTASGLGACEADRCRAALLQTQGARAGVAVRIVRVLQVVRVDLVAIDADGAVLSRSSRTMDIEAAARGPLFEDNALAFIAPSAPPPSDPHDAPDTPQAAHTPHEPPPEGLQARSLALIGAVAGGIVAVGALTLAVNEGVVANSATSLGPEKERARVLGPIASAACLVGLAGGVGGAVAAVLMTNDP